MALGDTNRLDLAPDALTLAYHPLFSKVGAPFDVLPKHEYAPDLISFEFYGTYDFWWVVLQFNGLMHPRELTTGLTIYLPSLNAVNATVTRGEQIALP